MGTELRRMGIALLSLFLAVCLSGCGGGGGDGGGGGGGGGSTLKVRFAFAGNFDGTVSVFGVDANPGGLRYLGYLKINGFAVQDIVVHPSNHYAYVLTSDGTLTAFSFDSQSGVLTLINSVSVGSNPSDILLDADGKFLYATSRGNSTISTYSIASATGALSAVGTPLPTGGEPAKIALAPSGLFAYVANRSPAHISIYTRNTSTGVLTLSATTTTLGDPLAAIIVNKAGTFAYVTETSSSNNVHVLGIDASTGNLTPVQAVSAGNTPLDIRLDNNNAFAYVANANSHNVSVFSINAGDGKLTSVQTIASGQDPRSLALDVDNKYLYVATFQSVDVSAYTVDATTGMLTLIDHFRARSGLNAIALSPKEASFVTRYVFAPDGDVHGYSVDTTTGTLNSPTTTAAGTNPLQMALTPNSRFAYVVNSGTINVSNSRSISVFQFDAATGTLGTNVQTVSPPSTWDSQVLLLRVIVEPSGRFLYLLGQPSTLSLPGRIAVYTINQTNGTLGSPTELSTGAGPENMVIHPAGRYLYSINSFGDTIALYEVDGSSGALALKQTFTPGQDGQSLGRPMTLAFHPNGRYAYVALHDDNELVRFFINPSNGFLESPQRTSTAQIPTDPRPRYIAVDPSGSHAYASHQSGDVSTWNIDPTTFSLSFAGTVLLQNQSPTWIAPDPHSRFTYIVVSGGIARATIGPGGALSVQETTTTGTGSSFSRTATIVSVIQ